MDIKQTIKANILEPIESSGKDFIYRKYETVLDWFGMRHRRNFEVLSTVDRALRKQKVTLWCAGEQFKSITNFNRGEVITFRMESNILPIEGFSEDYGNTTVKNKNAGTIKVVEQSSGIEFYKHQKEAIKNLDHELSTRSLSDLAGLLVLPTGGGKTLTAAYWICKNFLDKGKKVLWIAHRHELLEQAKNTFGEKLPFRDVFSAKKSFNYRMISGIHDKPVNIRSTDDLIISSKDSLNSGFEYLEKNWVKNRAEDIFLVIDEAHHATAKTYRRLIKNLREKTGSFGMLGLTATPFRTAESEQGLLARVFTDDIIFKTDLRTLIGRGILSEPIFETVKTEFDMTTVLTEKDLENIAYFDIDSIGKSSAKTIAENAGRNRAIVNRYVKNKKKYGQTIVFALNQDNAIALKRLFSNEAVKADFVLSGISDKTTGASVSSKENKQKIDRFRSGEIEVLINVNILTEGTDLPKVQTIFLTRPTISPVLMTQMIGRGLRGERAGGTKEAYIVSFVDNWQDKVSWVNPEKLFIEENVDFEDKTEETNHRLLRLISLNKLEEFAILTNQHLDSEAKNELEKIEFIERLPLGIYHFSFLEKLREDGNEQERNCEVLIYDNLKQSFEDFINALPSIFQKYDLTTKEALSTEELEKVSLYAEDEFFYGCEKYPAFHRSDIANVLQYFAQTEFAPKFVEFKNRTKYDITKIAEEIFEKNLGYKDAIEYKNELWKSSETEWSAFFGYDEGYFIKEIELAINRLSKPEIFKRNLIIPEDEKELRTLERMSMLEIREENPRYWKYLSDQVYAKFRDEEGFYFSAQSGFKSKNKLDFQIDHIKPLSKGGLSVLENLQLLTRKENSKKGSN